MTWNWQLKDWPNFVWDRLLLVQAEQRFLAQGGVIFGSAKHLELDEQIQLAVETISSEALTTSEIEGEIFDRASVQSSIRKQLGLATDKRRVRPGEQGIAEMMVDLYQTPSIPLTEEMLFAWHTMIMNGRRDLEDVGCYRTGTEPMQVVSGAIDEPKVHFEAPPSSRVSSEMARFILWFNQTSPDGEKPFPAVARAGIAHLYFESIHPFEDGNGRLGRAVAEKLLAQNFGQPTLIALAATILTHRSSYYKALELANKHNDITEWLKWFAGIAIEAQLRTIADIEFIIEKTRLFDNLRGQLNERQQKALLRLFQEGPDGFEGGLSASNYISITHASQATATRDLADLVEKQALIRTGGQKGTRYRLNIATNPVKRIAINKEGEIVES